MASNVQRFHADVAVMPKQSVASSLLGTGVVKGGRVVSGKVWVHHRVPTRKGKPASEQQPANAAEIARQFAVSVPYGFKPWDGPIFAAVLYQNQWIAKHKPKHRALGWLWNDTQPDLDNLHKPTFDILEKVGAFCNDARVCICFCGKVWCDQDAVDVTLSRPPRSGDMTLEQLYGAMQLKG